MSLKFLPKRIHIENLISELHLDHMPMLRALKTILLYAEHDSLPICFNETVTGIDANVPIGPQYDEYGESIDIEIADPMLMVELTGPKTIFRAFAYHLEHENQYLLSVYSFYHNDTLYYVPHQSGAALTVIDLVLDVFYCDRDDFGKFVNAMETGNKQTVPPTSAQQTKLLCDNELKALALLAKEKASKSARFKNGDKVNASAFKDHIVNLAEKNNISTHGLKKLDDKISKAQKKHDLKEV